MFLIETVKRWVNAPPAGGEAAEAPPPAGAEHRSEIAGLDFMAAIDVHMRWKSRLGAYIQGSSGEDLRVEAVSRDDQCALGKWIHGPGGQRYRGIDTFAEIERYHADFHRCAGKVLATAKSGQTEEALQMLQHGDYLRNSERVKMLLAKLFVQLHEKRKLEA